MDQILENGSETKDDQSPLSMMPPVVDWEMDPNFMERGEVIFMDPMIRIVNVIGPSPILQRIIKDQHLLDFSNGCRMKMVKCAQ